MKSFTGLQAFLEVARFGSFVAASEALGLSASAVSKSVRRLEEELGVKLFHRTTRSLSLTSDGQLFLDRSSKLVCELDDLAEELRGGEATFRGGFRITAPHVLGAHALMEPLAGFLAKHPDLRTEVRFDNRVVDLSEEGIDVAVRTGRLKESAHVIVTRFFEYQVVLCASPRLPRPRDLDELMEMPRLQFLMPGHGRPNPWRITFEGQPRELELPGAHTFEDLTAMALAAAAGLGATSLPTWCCYDLLQSGQLVELFPQYRQARTPVWLAYHERRHVSRKVLKFVEEMKLLGPGLTAKYCLEQP